MTTSLETALARLEDERAITRVLYDYGDFIDYGHPEAFIDLFTTDATFIMHYPEGATPRAYGTPRIEANRAFYEGRQAIEGFIRNHSHAPETYHKHVFSNIKIALDGPAARAQTYFMRVDATPDGPRIVAAGRYVDKLVKCPDGRWRMTSRIAEIEAR